MRTNIFLLLLFMSTLVFGQNKEEIKSNKGKIYASWGWNRSWYTTSDIRFQGNNYDFVLEKIKATDRPTPFDIGVYGGIKTISIPQTNLRIGFFISEHVDISFGVDHMKYVMIENQDTRITGFIENESNYEGRYDNDPLYIDQNFLKFEHTDGLNYLNLEVTYNQDLLKKMNVKMNPNKIELNYLLGFGAGAMMPKSNITLMNYERNDEFHIAGYGFAGKVGLNLTFYRFLFIRSEFKGGFTHLTDIRTTQFDSDRARQHFFFSELTFSVGLAINPFN